MLSGEALRRRQHLAQDGAAAQQPHVLLRARHVERLQPVHAAQQVGVRVGGHRRHRVASFISVR